MSINNVSIVGRLTRDPELRYSGSGTAICNFNVAVNRPFNSQDGQNADFINVVVFRKNAEALANYQRKGNLIGLTGRIQTRNFEGQDGKTVYVTEVVADSVQFLESKGNNEHKQQNNQPSQQSNEDPFKNDAEPYDISDESLPF